MYRVLTHCAIIGSLLPTLLFAGEGRCELITFAFTGTVTSVSVDRDYQGFDFPDVGDPFSGRYTFDSNAPDTANSPEHGGFGTVLPKRAVGIRIGEFQFEGRASVIGTHEDLYSAGDGIPSIELTSHAAVAELLDHNNFSLVIIKENLFVDPNVLPLTPPSLAGADEASLRMELDDRNDLRPFPEVSIVGTLESLRVVPEPSGMLITLIALMLSQQNRKRPTQSP
jgi:hypothetical protein